MTERPDRQECPPYGPAESILSALRAASQHFVMIDIKLPNVVFLRDRAFLIDFDPEFVRSAVCPRAFVAVQMLLIDLSAARVGSRVFSHAKIRAELRLPDETPAYDFDSTATELACVTMETTTALDARFRRVTARVLAKYTSGLFLEKFDEETLRYQRGAVNGTNGNNFASGANGTNFASGTNGANGTDVEFEFDVGSLVKLMRAAVGACYGPLVDRVGYGDVDVTPTRAARHEMAPRVDVHGARYDERHEVAAARVRAPVGQVRHADVVRDYGAYGLADAPLVEVERRRGLGAERPDRLRHRDVPRVGARSEVV